MSERDSSPPSSAVHAIMFWLLTSAAMVLFAACVLVPICQETSEAQQYEQAMAGLITQLEQQRTRNEAHIAALRADPLVNERILRRQLNCRPQGEQLIHWAPGQLQNVRVWAPEPQPAGMTSSGENPAASSRPRWVTALTRWLPAWPWQQLFGQAPSRTLMLLMAGGLLLTAFLLYHTPRDHSLAATDPGSGPAHRVLCRKAQNKSAE